MTTDQVRDDNLREPHLEEGVYSNWEVGVYSIWEVSVYSIWEEGVYSIWEVGVFIICAFLIPTPTFHLLFPILHPPSSTFHFSLLIFNF